MTLITFPRLIPDALPIVGMSFPPKPMIQITPLRSGRVISADLGPTLWSPRYQSDKMTPDEAGEVRAWYDTLLSANEFYGYDKLREYPLAYALGWGALAIGGNPFAGTCTLASVAGNNVQVALEDLPEGFRFSPGDYLAFDYSTSLRALHRVSAAAIADNSGQLTVEVRPHVRPGWTVGATVLLHRAAARMIILPDTYDEQTEAPWFTTISFTAIQSL
jgi:hypothetical protein